MTSAPRLPKHVHARVELWRAGKEALDQRAYDQAATYFERALALLHRSAATPNPDRAQLLLLLAGARHRGGEIERAQKATRSAVAEARRLDSAILLAQAGFIMGRTGGPRFSAERLALLAEARMKLGPNHAALGASLDAHLARELALNGDRERADQLSRSALRVARSVNDEATLATVLACRCTTLSWPSQEEERLALSAELLDRSVRIGDDDRVMDAYYCRIADLLALGDPAFDGEIRAASRLADTTRQPYHQWWSLLWRGMRAGLVGDFVGSKRLAAEAQVVGSHIQPRMARVALAVQTIVRIWQQGEEARLLALVDGFVAEHGDAYPESRSAHVWALAQGERRGDALRELILIAGTNFDRVLDVPSGGVTAALLAEACAQLNHATYAAPLYRRLLPSSGRLLILGPAVESLGPTDRYLGLLAALRQDWSAADHFFSQSLEISRRVAALPFIVRTLVNHATMLIARGRFEDRRRAKPMLEEAIAAARFGGLTAIVRQVEKLRQRTPRS